MKQGARIKKLEKHFSAGSTTISVIQTLHDYLTKSLGTAEDWKNKIMEIYRRAGHDGNLLYRIPNPGEDLIPANHIYTDAELREKEAELDKKIREYNPDDYEPK